MSYAVEALEPVREADLPRLDLETRRRIRRKIEQIRGDPHGYGKPLGRELAGLYKVRVVNIGLSIRCGRRSGSSCSSPSPTERRSMSWPGGDLREREMRLTGFS